MPACGSIAMSNGWCWHIDQPVSADAMRPLAEHALCGSVRLPCVHCNGQSSPANVVRLRVGCGLDSPCPGRSTASTRALWSRSMPSSKSAASSRLLADLSCANTTGMSSVRQPLVGCTALLPFILQCCPDHLSDGMLKAAEAAHSGHVTGLRWRHEDTLCSPAAAICEVLSSNPA